MLYLCKHNEIFKEHFLEITFFFLTIKTRNTTRKMAKTTAIPAMVSVRGKSELASSFLFVPGPTTKWKKPYNIY